MEQRSFIEECEMDWESLYCPNRRCRSYGCPFSQGQLVKNGRSHGQKQARCETCATNVSLRYGTTNLDLHADPAIFEMAVRALAEGNSIRATARIVQVDKDTICAWLDRAAQHCRLVMLSVARPPCPRMPAGRTRGLCAYQAMPFAVGSTLR
jgi:transposase-like protein